ncbi:hypothetical protein EV426DRAFT_681953 [Tirmania nivea]|nr:hypothetical protein EV426DRAFT_681953 [Tirmania nivea]
MREVNARGVVEGLLWVERAKTEEAEKALAVELALWEERYKREVERRDQVNITTEALLEVERKRAVEAEQSQVRWMRLWQRECERVQDWGRLWDRIQHLEVGRVGNTLAGRPGGKVMVNKDYMERKHALSNLSRGAPPRSDIEKELKDLLHERAHRETAIAYESALGRIADSQQVATAAGIRAAAKARRKDMRSEPGFGANRCLWHKHALSAYTWLRTNRGPQNYWLHFIRKVDSPSCSNCDHPSEDGHHIAFDCPKHHQQRQEFVGNARTWEDLDTPIWRREEGEEEEWDAVEAYFAYLYRPLAGR